MFIIYLQHFFFSFLEGEIRVFNFFFNQIVTLLPIVPHVATILIPTYIPFIPMYAIFIYTPHIYFSICQLRPYTTFPFTRIPSRSQHIISLHKPLIHPNIYHTDPNKSITSYGMVLPRIRIKCCSDSSQNHLLWGMIIWLWLGVPFYFITWLIQLFISDVLWKHNLLVSWSINKSIIICNGLQMLFLSPFPIFITGAVRTSSTIPYFHYSDRSDDSNLQALPNEEVIHFSLLLSRVHTSINWTRCWRRTKSIFWRWWDQPSS